MAGLMAASMVIIELAVMRKMYHNKRWNAVILTGGVAALLGCWFLIRQQTAIGDEQFLKSMIPHHAGAILMCNEAGITASEIEELCGDIVSSQEAEIARMKALLSEMN